MRKMCGKISTSKAWKLDKIVEFYPLPCLEHVSLRRQGSFFKASLTINTKATLVEIGRIFQFSDTALLGRSGMDDGDFGFSDEEILDQTQVRSFFPETWIYDEKVVG